MTSRARTVAAAAEREPVVVYVKGDPATKTLTDCPFTHRALLALEERGIPTQYVYIDLANKPKWFLEAVNPEGTVPALVVDEATVDRAARYLCDSGKIVEWADAHGDPPAGQLKDPEGSPGVAAGLFPALRTLMFAASEADVPAAVAGLEAQLSSLEAFLSLGGGPFIGGARPTAVDCRLGPQVYHAAVAANWRHGWSIPASMPKVRAYLEAWKGRASWRATEYGDALVVAGWTWKIKREFGGTMPEVKKVLG
ncbi:unnamed protein product [Pedinophyceae sp. YPF-701]|nr:unnamed protein product [Pedinophyceae sp. YPF-701]